MELTFRAALGLCLLALAADHPPQAATLRAGVAKADITPSYGVPLYGYMDRTKAATGTLDPLYARVCVLEAGEEPLALVTLDLGRTFGPASLASLRDAVKKSTGISRLFITASHTHGGPNILDEYRANQTPAWETAALEKIAVAVREARERMVEARIGAGYGRVYVGYNRRRVNPDGTVTMLWRNSDRKPTAPVDPRVSVLRVDSAAGQPLAILVNYACHPVVFGPDNLQYSADFVGVMARTVEDGLGGQPVCFFLQGGDGDINPYDATTPLGEGAVEKRDWTGRTFGEEALRVARRIRCEAVENPGIDFAEDTLRVPLRWNAQKFRQGLLSTFGPRVFEDHAEALSNQAPGETLDLDVTTVLINKRIAIAGLPGEPFVDFQMNFRDRCPVRDAFFVGYANGYFDYFPTIKAASEGGYGAGDSNTYVAPGTGERMVDQALSRVYEMLGRLADMPEDLKKT